MGYVEEYPAERAYRDSRGSTGYLKVPTRLTGSLLRDFCLSGRWRASLPLLPAINKLMDEVMAPPSFGDSTGSSNEDLAQHAKPAIARFSKRSWRFFTAGAASQKYMTGLADQQEVMADIADITMEVYSARVGRLLRARKLGGNSDCRFGDDAALCLPTPLASSNRPRAGILSAVAEGDTLRVQLAILRRLAETRAG